MITYSHSLYNKLERSLCIFERKLPFREEAIEKQPLSSKPYDVILFGLGRYGKAIAHYLQKEGFSLLAVDFNPDEVQRWREQGHTVMYGDASDPAFVNDLSLKGVKWVISAMPQHDIGVTHEDPRLALIEGLKQQQYSGGIVMSTQHEHDQQLLKDKGATLVLMPFRDAAERAVELIKNVSPSNED